MNKISNHRFYYSQMQEQVIEECRWSDEDDDGKSTFIKLDDGTIVKYTEWCSCPESKCNWHDAVLVAEFNASEGEIYQKIIRD